MTDDLEVKIRGVLSEYFGDGQWDGPHKPRFTPAAKKIAALVDPLARLADPSDKFACEVAQLKVPLGYPIDRVKAIARYLLTDGK